ncbi:MerR family transcriptional regulator, partial [Pseudodesulfovibrio sp.]|nr:MerR family transcriptional regulator [Pseudodesulfovibrio sp.]
MADTYTHKDLANLCSVSETTIKSYRRKFPGFIPVLTRGKPIRFKKEAGDVCLNIRDCFEKGMSVNETHRVLKDNFKEEPGAGRRAASGAHQTAPAVSQEYLEKFFETAGQMMQGMAGLATAQAKAEKRLGKVEDTLTKLLEIESRNSERFNEFLKRIKTPAADKSTAPPPPEAEPAAATAEQKVRARKIVNVKSPEGDVKSYSLEKEDTPPVLERPSDAFLNTPIVIKNDQGEFLGVPGRLSLSGFIEILIREAEEGGASLSSWRNDNDIWIFTMDVPGGDSHELHFSTTTTPKGNLVVLLDQLDVNNEPTTPQFLQEFFR